MQLCAALLAIVRALVVPFLPRFGAYAGITWPAASSEQKSAAWYLAGVLSLDVAAEYVNRLVNARLPAPNGPPLAGLARIGAHAGLAFYAAWVCCILAFVAWLARKTKLGAFVHHAAFGLCAGIVLSFVAAYPELRGDASLRVLGALHLAAFVAAVPCLASFARSKGEARLGIERVCGIWLVFLSLAAGVGPLRPWAHAPIDRQAAEQVTAVSMLVLYVSLVVTILAGGIKWIRGIASLSRDRYGSRRSPLS
jgi:hypothetical protein